MLEPPLTAAGDEIAAIKMPLLVRLSGLLTIVLPIVGILWVLLGFSVIIFVTVAFVCLVLVMPTYRTLLKALPLIPQPHFREGPVLNLATPDIQGPAQVGGVLVATTGEWQGVEEVDFQWQISTPDGFRDLEDCTHHWLYLDKDYLGQMIRVVVADDSGRKVQSGAHPVGPIKETDAETVRHPIKADQLESVAPALYPPRALIRIVVITAVILVVHTVANHYNFDGLLQ